MAIVHLWFLWSLPLIGLCISLIRILF